MVETMLWAMGYESYMSARDRGVNPALRLARTWGPMPVAYAVGYAGAVTAYDANAKRGA